MSKTSKELLQEVHSMLAEYFLEELKMAREEGIPMVSSTLSVIVTFLKNNEITADVQDDADLEELRMMLTAEKSGGHSSSVVEVADKVAQVMQFDPHSVM